MNYTMTTNKYLHVFLLLVLGTLMKTVSQEADFSCDPAAACQQSGQPGTSVPDPDDCHNYFLCISNIEGETIPSDNPVSCPNNTYFNTSNNCCDLVNEDEPCYQPCVNSECVFECDPESRDLYMIADIYDCNAFYVCTPGVDPTRDSCSEDKPYFDGQACTNDRYSCCDACVPFCKSIYIETMDPYDCNKYYLCEYEGIPSGKFHRSCDQGDYFDPNVGNCQPSIEQCKPKCEYPLTTVPTQSSTAQTSSPESCTTRTETSPTTSASTPSTSSSTPTPSQSSSSESSTTSTETSPTTSSSSPSTSGSTSTPSQSSTSESSTTNTETSPTTSATTPSTSSSTPTTSQSSTSESSTTNTETSPTTSVSTSTPSQSTTTESSTTSTETSPTTIVSTPSTSDSTPTTSTHTTSSAASTTLEDKSSGTISATHSSRRKFDFPLISKSQLLLLICLYLARTMNLVL